MPKSYRTLIEKYFNEHSFVESNINSFNNFIGRELQNIVDENREVVPTIIPPEIEDFKIRLGKIWVTKPEIVEGIDRMRAGKLKIRPGYDGEYGEVKIFTEEDRKKIANQKASF